MTGHQGECVIRMPMQQTGEPLPAPPGSEAAPGRCRAGAARFFRWLRLGVAWCCLLAGVGSAGLLAWSVVACSHSPTPAPAAKARYAEPSQSVAVARSRQRRIQDVRVGERVLGRNPQREGVEHSAEPDPASWRQLELHLRKRGGHRLEVVLLRPQEWLEARAARAGSQLWLDLPEMGAQGWAKVVSVGPCPPIEAGPGCVVTGTFKHEPDDNVLAVCVEGLAEPIGVTDTHPFWSEDRQAFVPVGQLRVGERVQTRWAGVVRITAITRRPRVDWVYNLEVHGEHVYEVSRLGLLVHNEKIIRPAQSSNPGEPSSPPGTRGYPTRINEKTGKLQELRPSRSGPNRWQNVPEPAPSEQGSVKVTLDLFGGETSQNPGAILVDTRAKAGVRGDATRLPFKTAAADEVIASNPYIKDGGGSMDWLPEASRSLKKGGRMYINATKGNKFGKLPDATALETLGLRIVQEAGPLDERFAGQVFRRTDGTVIPNASIKTTILEKVK